MRRADVIQYGAAVVVLALASMGQRCDPDRACPSGMELTPGVSVEEVIAAIKSGNPTNTEMCRCREGYEPNGATWIEGCHPSETPTTVTTLSTPTPTPVPTPKPTPIPTPISTPTPADPEPTSEPSPEPTPCGRSGGWWADGAAGSGCGPTGQHDCFPTRQAACAKRMQMGVDGGHLTKEVFGSKAFFHDPGRGWYDTLCRRYADGRTPGRLLNEDPGYAGVERTPGYEDEPCPEPSPTPGPTPEPSPPPPTPEPSECRYTHFNLVWLCAQPSKPGCLDGKDWGRPGIVHINRDGKPICKVDGEWRMCVRVFLTAVLFNGHEKIEAGHACFPGPIPEYRTETDADGNECTPTTCETSWFQTWPPTLRFDCGHPWGDGWNNGSCNIDFAARNDFKLCAFGVCGETTMTSDWR